MFVQQKKLTVLTLPSSRVRRLLTSTVDVQVALSGFPSQMASAYLVALKSGVGIQVVLGFFLADSRISVFFLPEAGEVTAEKADSMLEDGLEFAESIGFVLADADVDLMTPEQLDKYWRKLPICNKFTGSVPVTKKTMAVMKAPVTQTAVDAEKTPVTQTAVDVERTPVPRKVIDAEVNPVTEVRKVAPLPARVAASKPPVSLEERRSRCKESLGRFLAAL